MVLNLKILLSKRRLWLLVFLTSMLVSLVSLKLVGFWGEQYGPKTSISTPLSLLKLSRSLPVIFYLSQYFCKLTSMLNISLDVYQRGGGLGCPTTPQSLFWFFKFLSRSFFRCPLLLFWTLVIKQCPVLIYTGIHMHYIGVLHHDILRLYNRIIPVEKIIIVLKNGKTHSIFQQLKNFSFFFEIKKNFFGFLGFFFSPPL